MEMKRISFSSIAILGLVAILLGINGCSAASILGPSGKAEYSITGTATRVDITYQNGNGGTSQVSGAAVPWTLSLSNLKKDDFLYVSAQIVNTTGGSISVKITSDGKDIYTGSASGFAAIGTASGGYK